MRMEEKRCFKGGGGKVGMPKRFRMVGMMLFRVTVLNSVPTLCNVQNAVLFMSFKFMNKGDIWQGM